MLWNRLTGGSRKASIVYVVLIIMIVVLVATVSGPTWICPKESAIGVAPPPANRVAPPPATSVAPLPTARFSSNLYLGEKNRYYPFTKIQLSAEARHQLSTREKWSTVEWSIEVNRTLHRNAISAENITIVALVNHGMTEMMMNWIASLKMTGHDKWVALCFDFKVYRFLVEHGFGDNAAMVPSGWLHKEIVSVESKWGQQSYIDLLQAKLFIIENILKLNVYLFYVDIDVVFCSPHVIEHILYGDAALKTDLIYMIEGVSISEMSKFPLQERATDPITLTLSG